MLYLYYGSLYNANGCEIKRPTVLIDPELDGFHGWGEYENIMKKQAQYSKISPDVVAIELTHLPKPLIAYIILRMMNYTQSGFITKFYDQAMGLDAMTWLTSEVNRVPIEIPDKPED